MKAAFAVLADLIGLFECAYSAPVPPAEYQFGGGL
jgi:hypothetical protein